MKPTTVRMITREPDANTKLMKRFEDNFLAYEGIPFAGLLSPSSTIITESTVRALDEHVLAIDEYVSGVLEIYAELINNHIADETTHAMFEWGLNESEVRHQRESTIRGDRPSVGRLDCVDLGTDHFVTEIQWKGAGEGWLASIDRSYREAFPLEVGQRPFGDLIEAWTCHFKTDGTAVNTGRSGWMDAEKFLIKELRQRDTKLESCVPADIQNVVHQNNGRFFCKDGTVLRYLFLDRLSEVMDSEFLDAIVQAYVAGELAIDPPPSYVFNEKLPLSLPFVQRYRDHFSDRVRRLLIPTTLLGKGRPELSFLAPQVDHGDAEALTSLSSWEDIYELDEGLRNQLVLKCGSADQYDNHGGHGVFRLGGSRSQVRELLDPILKRVVTDNEPWVLQPYMGRQWSVGVTHMSRSDELTEMNLHAKFGVYFRLQAAGLEHAEVLGGICSLGTTWKVSGASKTPAVYDDTGTLSGAFRHDIRVVAD